MNKWIVSGLMGVMVVLALQLAITAQSLQTVRTILNNVWDRVNHRLMTTPGVGAQGVMETEQTIWNDVWDAGNNMLRISGGGGEGSVSSGFPQYAQEALPIPCTPYSYATVTDNAEIPLQICNVQGDGWSAVSLPTPVGSSTTNPTGMASGVGEIVGMRYATSVVSVNKVLGLEHSVCVDTGTDGVTLTLPFVTSSPVSEYVIVICAGTGSVTLQPSGGDLLAGVNAPQSIVGVRSRMDVSLIGGAWHLVSTEVLSEESQTEVIQLPVTSVRFPTSNPAQLDNSETNPRLLFDATTSECVVFGPFVLPPGYVGSPALYTVYSFNQTQSGAITFIQDVAVMAINPAAAVDVNTESYDTVNSCTGSGTSTTAGFRQALNCVLTNNDGMIARALVKLRMCRNVSDTGVGDVEVLHAMFSYSR